MRARELLSRLPGIKWEPSDLPSTDPPSKKPRSRFSLRPHHPSKDDPTLDSPAFPTRRRKSTLSLTSAPDPELDARTDVQGQSPFFAKLPLEIRIQIYELVLSGEGETVHLTLGGRGRGHLGHFVCEDEDQMDDSMKECGCKVLVGGRDCRKLEGWIVGFLRICRRIYSEAISTLYKFHTFSLLHSTHLLYLPSRLPAPRLNNIRSLRLRWAIRALPYYRRPRMPPKPCSSKVQPLAYPEDTQNWQRGWHIIASMRGLRELFVVLTDPSPNQLWEQKWIGLEKELLEPAKLVIQPRWFELMLPYEGCNTGIDMGASACRLKKPEAAGDEDSDD
ncbi:hypothetical protein BCR34DRAFT_599163 [Clohesyomyces aquaticus]|uniref:DUF7730 domain-containing protein n=1 Tax=Clohesyomyces aquaticus TaxID=1231657 RepID=A0A1Y1ZVY8_9PLEO|nr:hypothetical protein BCR34DRAFT_599163 [Clohesyomyces aquaticus]